jgi:hypothetical protein
MTDETNEAKGGAEPPLTHSERYHAMIATRDAPDAFLLDLRAIPGSCGWA